MGAPAPGFVLQGPPRRAERECRRPNPCASGEGMHSPPGRAQSRKLEWNAFPPRRAERECRRPNPCASGEGMHSPPGRAQSRQLWCNASPAASGEGMPEAKSLRQRGGNAQPAAFPNQSRTQSAPDITPERIPCTTRRELLRVAHHTPFRSISIGISLRH